MIPTSHHGTFRGPNRLWFEGPLPETSEGSMEAARAALRYRWSFRGEPQEGELLLRGPGGAVGASWKDTWHAARGMELHGRFADGELVLYGTYSGGEEGPEWGWRIELDARDPEHLVLRMFNLEPGGGSVLAVDLRGARVG